MLRKTVLAHALSIAFTATVTSMVVLPAAYAQSNTTGAISGKAPAGATVVLENKAIGVTRTIKVSSDGSYSVPQ